MPTVYVYEVESDYFDPHQNHIASCTSTVETDQHHDDHGGAHTASFKQHIHTILHPHSFKAVMKELAAAGGGAVVAGHTLNDLTAIHKSIRYAYKESAPYRQRVKNVAVNLVRRAARAFR